MANYSDKLKNPKWQKKRLEIFNRDNFKCIACGDTETTLNIHHLKYSKEPWDIDNEELVTLCEHCHNLIESIKPTINDFKSLIIIKKIFSSDEYMSKLFFIFFDKTIYFVSYDQNKKIALHLTFGNEITKALSELFIKYLPEK